MILLGVAAGWVLLTRPAYRIEGDFLQREDKRHADAWLAEQMQSPIAEHRARACLALGRIGDPETLDLLISAVKDPIPRVRAGAAFAIGEMEVKPMGLYGLEFDDEGLIRIWFVPIRPGNYEFYIDGHKQRGMVGTFIVR